MRLLRQSPCTLRQAPAGIRPISHPAAERCRDDDNDSCGFEHVFVGEIDDGHVKGLHNWIQTMVEEARGNLDYMGFVLPKRCYQDDGDDHVDGTTNLISIQLGWEVRPWRAVHAADAVRAVFPRRAAAVGDAAVLWTADQRVICGVRRGGA